MIQSPAQALRDAMDERGMDVTAVALRSMLLEQTIRRVLDGKQPITKVIDQGLCRAFDTEPEHWLRLEEIQREACGDGPQQRSFVS